MKYLINTIINKYFMSRVCFSIAWHYIDETVIRNKISSKFSSHFISSWVCFDIAWRGNYMDERLV